jgi:hypothetical protein
VCLDSRRKGERENPMTFRSGRETRQMLERQWLVTILVHDRQGGGKPGEYYAVDCCTATSPAPLGSKSRAERPAFSPGSLLFAILS